MALSNLQVQIFHKTPTSQQTKILKPNRTKPNQTVIIIVWGHARKFDLKFLAKHRLALRQMTALRSLPTTFSIFLKIHQKHKI